MTLPVLSIFLKHCGAAVKITKVEVTFLFTLFSLFMFDFMSLPCKKLHMFLSSFSKNASYITSWKKESYNNLTGLEGKLHPKKAKNASI